MNIYFYYLDYGRNARQNERMSNFEWKNERKFKLAHKAD